MGYKPPCRTRFIRAYYDYYRPRLAPFVDKGDTWKVARYAFMVSARRVDPMEAVVYLPLTCT